MDQPGKVAKSCSWSAEQGKWIFPSRLEELGQKTPAPLVHCFIDPMEEPFHPADGYLCSLYSTSSLCRS